MRFGRIALRMRSERTRELNGSRGDRKGREGKGRREKRRMEGLLGGVEKCDDRFLCGTSNVALTLWSSRGVSHTPCACVRGIHSCFQASPEGIVRLIY